MGLQRVRNSSSWEKKKKLTSVFDPFSYLILTIIVAGSQGEVVMPISQKGPLRPKDVKTLGEAGLGRAPHAFAPSPRCSLLQLPTPAERGTMCRFQGNSSFILMESVLLCK